VPEDRPKFTFIVKGKYWRFRRGDLKAVLPGKPGQAMFAAEYARLLALSENKPAEIDKTTLQWLIAQYRKSAEFEALRPLTRLDYDKILAIVERELGEEPYKFITSKMVREVRNDLARSTPRQAEKVKALVSLIYAWAAENDLVELGFNPAAPIKKIRRRIKPIEPWREHEIKRVLGTAPLWLKTPLMLALYTGQRREDVVRMEWSDYQGGAIRVRQSKTGEPLDIACHKALREHLEAVKTKFGGKIARTAKGRPFTANSLSQALRRVVGELDGFPQDRSMHGLRYAAAARLDEAGCTVTEAVAVMGHRTYQMALKYMAQRRASEAATARQEASE
jgi:integrase